MSNVVVKDEIDFLFYPQTPMDDAYHKAWRTSCFSLMLNLFRKGVLCNFLFACSVNRP